MIEIRLSVYANRWPFYTSDKFFKLSEQIDGSGDVDVIK
jgi:hypothetical protein